MITQRLEELRASWRVTLKSTDEGWRLVLATKFTDQPFRLFEYEGTDLERIVNNAWAGAPEGRV